MKKSVAKILGLSIATASILVMSTSTNLAWFDPTARVDDSNVIGETQGSYFKSGTGKSDDPYILDNPIHVYNLAWLQYIGYFNSGQEDDGTGAVAASDQVYFKLDGDIDMTGINSAIPPIGTSKYPFIGNFDGAGYTISNCQTSNDYSDTTKHPYAITSLEDVECVGFFGVVGALSNQTFSYSKSINEIKNFGLTSSLSTANTSNVLIGNLAGYANGTISNCAVDACEIDINTNASAIPNIGTNRISDYGLIGFSTNTKNIVKYSNTAYGVTTAPQIDQFPVEDEGSSSSWGGSINMNKIYTNLNTIWKNTPNAGAVTSMTEKHDKFGHFVSRTETTSNTAVSFPYAEYENRFSTEGDDNHYYVNKEIKSNNDVTSSFSFVKRTDDSTGQYISITGDRDILTQNGYNGSATTSVTTDKFEGRLIKINNTNNHLSQSNGQIENQTNSSLAALWSFDSILGTIYTPNGNTGYYLNCNSSGVLSLVQNAPSNKWSYDSTIGYNITVSGTRYVLGFDGTNWVTTTMTGGWWYIRSGTNYLTTALERRNNPTNPSTVANIRWYKIGDYYATSTNASTYLGATQKGTQQSEWSWDSWSYVTYYTYTYTLSASANEFFYTKNGNYLSFSAPTRSNSSNQTTYYLRYSGNQFSCSTSSTQLTIEQQPITYAENINSTSVVLDSHINYSYNTSRTYNKAQVLHSYPTYWPLKNVGDNTETTSDDTFGVPEKGNTGYIVGGANYTGDPSGDIRFSNFSGEHRQGNYAGTGNPTDAAGYYTTKDSLRNSYTVNSNTFNHVYTINDSGRSDVMTLQANDRAIQYPKFEKASARLIKNLKQTYTGGSGGEIPGLHFMDTEISYGVHDGVDKSAYVENAIIYDNSYSTNNAYKHYEVPTTCIDFNLKEKGRITFFAGTYFWGNTTGNKNNNCFFSLHTVERYTKAEADAAGENDDIRENGIKSVKEIKYIYKHKTLEEEDYVYQYSDDTYSVMNFNVSSYNKVFDTAWIKKQTSVGAETTGSNNWVYLLDAAYYFEIPVNGGEYALGSVSGGDGGYLMYLDIGANAALINRRIFGEKNIRIKDEYTIPLGVALIQTSQLKTALAGATVKPEESAFVSIYAGSSVDFTFTQTNATTATVTGTSLGTAEAGTVKGGYVYDNIALHDPGGTKEGVPRLRTTIIEEQTQFVDYNAAMAQTTRTAIVTTTTSTIDDFGVKTGPTPSITYWQLLPDSTTKVTDSSKIVYYDTDGQAVAITSVQTRQAASEHELISFKFETDSGVVVKFEFMLTVSPNQTSHYCDITGYDIKVVDGSGNPIEVSGVGVSISEPDANGTQTITITLDGTQYVITFNPVSSNP